MEQNLETKAYCADPDRAREVCGALGGALTRIRQTDEYFAVNKGRLKLRSNDNRECFLIYYERRDSPEARESDFSITKIKPNTRNGLRDQLLKALGIIATVQKTRCRFVWDTHLVNVDEITGLGSFLEIEVFLSRLGQYDAHGLIAELQNRLTIGPADIVPWSYSDFVLMQHSASYWRAKLRQTQSPGSLFLIDGSSGSGKSTILHRVLSDPDLRLSLIPRYCTRNRRAGSPGESEHHFVSPDELARLRMQGGLMEMRDFKFQMSYGLPWDAAMTPLLNGGNAVGLINLGNGRHVKKIFPEANTIMISAPIAAVERRLVSRGVHTPAQIAERLDNARRVRDLESSYDHVAVNRDGDLESAVVSVRSFILKATGQA